MNEWNDIWNGFCDEVAISVRKNNLEKVFEKDIANEFFRALDWYRLNKGLQEQYPIKFATATHRADFALFVPNKEKPEIIVELKRPQKKREEKDAEQLIDYMRKVECSFGILLLGDKLEVYYIDFSKPEHEAMLVETIKFRHDSEAAKQLMDVLYRKTYEPAKMLEYCHKRVKVNKSVEYWCSLDGKTEVMDMIIERSKLPDYLTEIFRSTLIVDIKRKDGLTPVNHQPVMQPREDITHNIPTNNKPDRRERKVWMVPANPKYFDHKGCFDELGHIYWKQFNNFQVGDIGYIYISAPIKCIVFKFEVVACNLTTPSDYYTERKFYKKAEDFENAQKHGRFYDMKRIGEHTTGILTLENMKMNGLKGAPMGTLNLSDKSFEKLLAYIEQNF